MSGFCIKTKLFLGFGIAALLLMICSGTGILSVSAGTRQLREVEAVDQVRNDVGSIVAFAASISDAIKGLALTDDEAERQKMLEGIGALRKAYKAKLDAVAKNATSEDGQRLLGKLKDALATGKLTNQKLIEAGMKGDRSSFIELYKNEGKAAFERVRDASKDLDDYFQARAAAKTEAAISSGKTEKVLLLASTAAALAVSFLISGLIARAITRRIRSCVAVADRIAEGDLSVDVDHSGTDEVAQLLRAMHHMVGNMKQTIGAVTKASMAVSSAATQLHSTSKEMVTGADQVVQQSHTVGTAGEEMAATSNDIANSCHITATTAGRAHNAAVEGSHVVQRSISAMEAIAGCVKSAADTVASLGSRSEQIGEIVGTIEDIADQTNLLALNAAIEAARAGEQGRGFAVVADEVRALAERTTKATREIGLMIKTIQGETKEAVEAMNQGVSEVERGTGEVARSGDALEAILEQIAAVTQQASQIATAAEEQTATTSEISANMQRITEIVRNSARGAQETDNAASELTRLADELHQNVGRFRLAA
ncbi:methyl-accepting chemotaxis protein [Geomesophilobacter sediminis]|uniref:Methyl-accepting chemotaxis protein n=1 Tax=Geomesophilobacter sediminis TaxID=2798584 RepID=A0A8J7S702_9BACT|nr:methyl-accepting chemotaxis protein [Geomesophilobacter sediminis]MBJ6726682.1 methyl-accepting chemotaxis protein [Geomesophilobacter sediminis]